MPAKPSYEELENKVKLLERQVSRQEQAELEQLILDTTDAHMAVVDRDGTVVYFNKAWRRFAQRNSAGPEAAWGLGANYFTSFSEDWGDVTHAEEAFEGLRRVLCGELAFFEIEYPCHSPADTKQWFLMRVLPLNIQNGIILVSHTDITDRVRAEKTLEKQNRRATLLKNIAEIFLTVPDDDMYGEVLQLILEATESKFGVFGYIDHEGALVTASMTKDIYDKCQVPDRSIRFPHESWKNSDSIWARALRRKKSLLKNEPGNVPEGHLPIDNVLTTPIMYRDQVIGNFEVANKTGGYSEAEKTWLEEIANFVAPVLKARLERDSNEAKQKAAEESLKQREELFKRLFQESPVSIIIHDKDTGEIVDANKTAWMSYGFSSLEELRAGAFRLEPPYSFTDALALIRKALKEGPLRIEWMNRKASGEVFWELVTLARVTLGDLERVMATSIDITERKRAEEDLEKSERFYRSVLSSIHEDILVIDGNYRVTDINNTALKTLAVDRAKVVGSHCYEISHNFPSPCHEHGQECPLEWVFENGEPVNSHHLHIRGDGTIAHVDVLMSPLKDEQGNTTHVVEAVRDVTDLFESREALLRSERLLNDTQEASITGGWEYDVQTGEIKWTRETYRIHGVAEDYNPSDITKNISFYSEEDQETIQEAFNDAVLEGRPYDLELKFKSADGTQKWVRTMGKALLKDGKVVRVLGNIMDITERKQMEEEKSSLEDQLRQAQKVEAIGQLAGGVAHDFNNALTVIMSNADMMLMDIDTKHPFYRDLEQIKKVSQKAANLTRQLLAFSRKQILQPEILDLNEIVVGIKKMLGRLIHENIELNMDLAPDLGPIEADPGQLEQVIINLAVNAGDAMLGGGKLTIETKNVELDEDYASRHAAVKPGLYVMMAVTDTGAGMTKEVQERIFEPFFTTKEEGKGTGLGLSTVYGIVKQSSGNIYVYSEPGMGTTVKIYLPRLESATVERKETTEERRSSKGTETILTVEDDDILRNVVVKFLSRDGYRVLTAANGEEALRICREHGEPIHLLLTDMVMPGMSGKELAGKAKELRPDLKVLFMSGYADSGIVENGVLEKGTALIQKPFTGRDLAVHVRKALEGES